MSEAPQAEMVPAEAALRRILARAAEGIEPSLPVPFDLPGWEGARRSRMARKWTAALVVAMAVALVALSGDLFALSRRVSHRVTAGSPSAAGDEAPAQIALAIKGFAPLPVRLPAALPAGTRLIGARSGNFETTTGGLAAHSLDVWYLLPQGAMVHIRQIDAPAVPEASLVPDPRGTSEQIGGRTWTRVALAGLPGAAEFSTRFDDGVRLSIDFTTGDVDAGALLASLHSG